jgi:uncharacterized protein YdaT
MPWDERHYPRAMRNLDPLVRERAIHIANALLEDGREEGFAIRVAIGCARDWAYHRARAAAAARTNAGRPWPRPFA